MQGMEIASTSSAQGTDFVRPARSTLATDRDQLSAPFIAARCDGQQWRCAQANLDQRGRLEQHAGRYATGFGQVTETDRARYAVELYEQAQTEWPWIGAVNYWFFKRATDSKQDQPFYYFRLMEPDFTISGMGCWPVTPTTTAGAGR